MALDPKAVDQVGAPEWWMRELARRLLDRSRVLRLATLEAYKCGCPPMPYLAPSERKGFYNFHRVSRTNFARRIVNARAERQRIRAIRTAAANDDNGDDVAWSYFKRSGLHVTARDVESDRWTYAEAYVRVALDGDGMPIAMRRDPRFTITAQDPVNPQRTIAAFELVWDEWAGYDYAYLWLPGKQYVAERKRGNRPPQLSIPGITISEARRFGYWWPRLSFSADSFTMRPELAAGEAGDGRPYSQSYETQRVPVERFDSRDGVGAFEEHLDLLDRINHTIMQQVVIAAIQAFKQRALEQPATDASGVPAKDRLPDKDPDTGETIDWDDVFAPGPDALWKLPPGVKIWESAEVNMQGILQSANDAIKQLSEVASTYLPLMSDAENQAAAGAQNQRESLTFSVEDANVMDGQHWANVMSIMFEMAPDAQRYDDSKKDRADVGQIVIDYFPAERYSLGEKAQADGQNKSLSADMAAAKIWQLTPDEVNINRAQRAADALIAPPPVAANASPGPPPA